MVNEKDIEFLKIKLDLEEKLKKENEALGNVRSELEILRESSNHDKAKIIRLQEKMDSAIKQQTGNFKKQMFIFKFILYILHF